MDGKDCGVYVGVRFSKISAESIGDGGALQLGFCGFGKEFASQAKIRICIFNDGVYVFLTMVSRWSDITDSFYSLIL
jgi:hypothetical protein